MTDTQGPWERNLNSQGIGGSACRSAAPRSTNETQPQQARCSGAINRDGGEERSGPRTERHSPPKRCKQRQPADATLGQQTQKERDALRSAPGCTKLLRLWRRAASQFEMQGAECDDLWQDLAPKLNPIIYDRVRKGLRTHTYAGHEHSEIVQEVYLRLLRSDAKPMRACKAGNDSQLVAYLQRITDSVLADSLRKVRAVKRGRAVTVRFGWQATDGLVDLRPCLENALVSRSELGRFQAAIRKCASHSPQHSCRNSRIVEAALLGGQRSSEIADHLGLKASSVDSVVSRMRQRLSKEGWEFSSRPT